MVDFVSICQNVNGKHVKFERNGFLWQKTKNRLKIIFEYIFTFYLRNAHVSVKNVLTLCYLKFVAKIKKKSNTNCY